MHHGTRYVRVNSLVKVTSQSSAPVHPHLKSKLLAFLGVSFPFHQNLVNSKSQLARSAFYAATMISEGLSSHDLATTLARDPVADWKAFSAKLIPSKGIHLPTLFHQTVDALQKQKHPSLLNILELGCGCGALAHSLLQSGHNVTGIDINEQAIEMAKEQQQKQQQMNGTGRGRFLMADVTKETFSLLHFNFDDNGDNDSYSLKNIVYDFCILQLLLSIVGGPPERLKTLKNAFSLLCEEGTLYLSCSGVSDDVNPNYRRLYQKDVKETGEKHSYFSRDADSNEVLYTTHHFTAPELESLLNRAGFHNICIQKHKEASSRRPTEVAYFLYATAKRPGVDKNE